MRARKNPNRIENSTRPNILVLAAAWTMLSGTTARIVSSTLVSARLMTPCVTWAASADERQQSSHWLSVLDSRLDDVHQRQRDEHGDQRGDDVEREGLAAEAAEIRPGTELQPRP